MRKIYQHFLISCALVLSLPVTSQVSAYYFAQSNGSYTPITGGTVVATATANTNPGNLAALVWNLPNGTFSFPYVFNGIPYTGCNISCNGYITFGTTPPLTTGGSPISVNTGYAGCISAWGRTNNGAFALATTAAPTVSYTSEVRVQELGTAPSRTFVIQFDNWRYSSGTGLVVWLQDWQIRLIETTNVAEVVYGDGVMAGGSLSTSGFNAQVGLRGATNADYNNRNCFGLFNTSTTGTINTASEVIGVTNGVGIFMPNSGLTYRWYPPCSSGSQVTPTITAASTVICEGDTLNFTANGSTPFIDISYQWMVSTTQGGPYTNVVAPPTGTNFASYKKPGAPGIYYYVLQTACLSLTASVISNEIILDVRPLPILNIFANPALNTTVNPIETCFGQTYTLTATGAATYSWVNGPTTNTYGVQPANNPSYIVSGTSIDGCVATRTLNIQVDPLPQIITSISPALTTCPGKPVVVGASGTAVSYTWSSPNSTQFLITVTPTTSTIYSVTGTGANGCTNTAVQQVLVHSVKQLTLSTSVGSLAICKGEEINLLATGAINYTWTSPNTYTVGGLFAVSPQVTTTYSVISIDQNGCEARASIVQQVDNCTGLHDNGSFTGLSIYPNPNNGVFTVELKNGSIKTFEVMDVTGKVVASETTGDDSSEMSIRELPAGVYYLRVRSDNAVQVVKIVKQ
jgi:hypothetical protein